MLLSTRSTANLKVNTATNPAITPVKPVANPTALSYTNSLPVDLKLKLSLNNWRCFDHRDLAIPLKSLLIIDQNGSGKTSILTALYTLFTGLNWPKIKNLANLKSSQNYFGISLSKNWYFSGKISSNGRLTTKACLPTPNKKLPFDLHTLPKIISYEPTDNYWLVQSRVGKLSILDDLLTQIHGVAYLQTLYKQAQIVKSKQNLLKNCIKTGQQVDSLLLGILNKQLVQISLKIWPVRSSFLCNLSSQLKQFCSWIQSPIEDWLIKHSLSKPNGDRAELNFQDIDSSHFQNQNQALEFFGKKLGLDPAEDLKTLWPRELASGKVLFGSQRDDFKLVSKSSGLEVGQVLSRGEMRLLILFIKNFATKIIQNKISSQDPKAKSLVFWFLDDVFNEFDSIREKTIFQEILCSVDLFIATGTKKPFFEIPTYKIEDFGCTPSSK